MPRLTTSVVVALLAASPVFSATEKLYDQDDWSVSFEEEFRPLEPACIIMTVQDEGSVRFYQMPGYLEARIVRTSDIPLEPLEDTILLVQVDDHDPWKISTDMRSFVLYLYDLPELLVGQMAAGETLKIDYNLDGRIDDRFSMANGYPAMKAMAECVTRFE